jgi:hypothetical protein
VVRLPELIARRSLSRFYSAWPGFASKSYPPLSFYRLSQPPEVDNDSFRFRKARGVRQEMASSPVSHSIFPHQQRVRPRAGLGSIGTVLVLMGVGIGVLIIRFILVFAHTVLQ